MNVFSTTANPNAQSIGLLILRIAAGCFMMTHGLQKLSMLNGEGPVQFGDPIGVGEVPSLYLTIFAEVVCSFLLIIGLATRLAAIPLAITMAVAFFIVHAADAFGDKELSAVYLVIYIYLAIAGAGKYSVDYLISRKKGTGYYTA